MTMSSRGQHTGQYRKRQIVTRCTIEGTKAFKRGTAYVDNPYSRIMFMEHHAWAAGWIDAESYRKVHGHDQ